MKYLSDYMEKKQTDLFEKTGSFFAFGRRQFNEAKKEGVEYVDMGAGLICPKDTWKELDDGLDVIWKQSIAQDIRENGKKGIIKRELYNHETFYTLDIQQTVDALICYGFSREEINSVYKNECKVIDWDKY